mmetsp:Transcript_27241/g.49495  ORF Transcript_27241/g.49495 Transcript_27241/m.49495 type:complete len:205 (-) Transcript_27241:185-799(-)
MKSFSTGLFFIVTFLYCHGTNAGSFDHREHALRGRGKGQNTNRMIRGQRALKVMKDGKGKGKGKGKGEEEEEDVYPVPQSDPCSSTLDDSTSADSGKGKSGKGKSGKGKSGAPKGRRRLETDIELISDADANTQQDGPSAACDEEPDVIEDPPMEPQSPSKAPTTVGNDKGGEGDTLPTDDIPISVIKTESNDKEKFVEEDNPK